ncbi:MAG: sn-glycerol-3-phosphate ABC transporter ATP-binding protein UgpC [Deltaproteobacteria bacterium]|jgi:sn-glycerol 3-phosphate transport system ATP-binding protein|tara:strand:+ start:3238 stop:4293 length:1056 start_codon:yes stop_codon:yes gene_type:complete
MSDLLMRDIYKNFGETKVIHGINIEISDGEFIVILGPSGCGKSTLLRMIAGLETVTSGEIFINNIKVNDVEPMDRNIAMVFQNYALYPHMTVYNNMSYGLKIAGFSKNEIKDRVDKASEMLQIKEYLDRKPRELSGGQRQRVAMGRAIVRNPSVFLFDEPLSNLDAKLRIQMRLEIKSLQKKLGTTSLFVTHDQVEAMTLADRIIVMNEGVTEQIGTPLEVFETPKSIFVAQFIGSPAMNIIEGSACDGGYNLKDGTLIKCPNVKQKEVYIGIRPEDMVPDDNGDIRLKVNMPEPIGSTTIIHGELANSKIPLIVHMQGLHNILDLNQFINFSVPLEKIHFFDKKTGLRIN